MTLTSGAAQLARMDTAKLTCVDVGKVYKTRQGASVTAIQDISLSVASGEFVSILGPSGCGKSTLLYIAGGFLSATSGHVLVDGAKVHGPAASRGIVFQDHSLFPWKSVLGNVAYGLRAQGVGKQQAYERAREFLRIVNLADIEDRYPRQLSGGMRQRVAIARTLAADPEVVLLDEPLGALDALNRAQLQDELSAIWREAKKTMLMVTHSIEEAIMLSDRIYVMSGAPGRIVKDLIVDIPRPREREAVLTHPNFAELEHRIWELLH